MSELRGRCKHCDGYYCDNVGGCPVGGVVAELAEVATARVNRIADQLRQQQSAMSGLPPRQQDVQFGKGVVDSLNMTRDYNLSQQWHCIEGNWKRVR